MSKAMRVTVDGSKTDAAAKENSSCRRDLPTPSLKAYRAHGQLQHLLPTHHIGVCLLPASCPPDPSPLPRLPPHGHLVCGRAPSGSQHHLQRRALHRWLRRRVLHHRRRQLRARLPQLLAETMHLLQRL